uniref:BRCA2 and CDKN1A interacting protein n=1 Tax=Hucho hucho TaxID=62062 RepID=A0A4W5LHL6_9TELE
KHVVRFCFQEVIVDFEAHTITHNDYNGVKKLLQQLFLKAHVNTSELTDLLIQQNHIGSVIRQAEVPEDSEEDEDPADEVFGFISMLNLTERKVGTGRYYMLSIWGRQGSLVVRAFGPVT